jgi:heptosyltransferase-3
MNRILVIRDGALGDFVLTLPAIKLLREEWPQAHLEILGWNGQIALADKRFYADAVRTIEEGALKTFFATRGERPQDLADYFASFDLVVSYLFDPDGACEMTMLECGVERFIGGPKFMTDEHAAVQLAAPMRELDLMITSSAAELFLNDEDVAAATELVPDPGYIALHPGSGRPIKNWPISNWIELGRQLAHVNREIELLVIGGKTDAAQIGQLRAAWADLRVRYVISQPMRVVAAILARCRLFVGHDTGISHVAAAAGARCVLLFGPTDPLIWAPANKQVLVLQAPDGALERLAVADVVRAATS